MHVTSHPRQPSASHEAPLRSGRHEHRGTQNVLLAHASRAAGSIPQHSTRLLVENPSSRGHTSSREGQSVLSAYDPTAPGGGGQRREGSPRDCHFPPETHTHSPSVHPSPHPESRLLSQLCHRGGDTVGVYEEPKLGTGLSGLPPALQVPQALSRAISPQGAWLRS